MSAIQGVVDYQIQLKAMPRLFEAVDSEDDWTGLTDAAARRKRQNRLNVRAYRRRKAENAKKNIDSKVGESRPAPEPEVPCWIEDQQLVSNLPISVAATLHIAGSPLIPRNSARSAQNSSVKRSQFRIMFPLSPDHLITLLQYNALRGGMINSQLLYGPNADQESECSAESVLLPPPPSLREIPWTLYPTHLQQTVAHEKWIDIVPHPVWRDNMIRASGSFDEDDLWSDCIGGLFEGFPGSEIEKRGVILWSPPWHPSGWEISEGFARKWGWTLKGCRDVVDASNKRRMERGEELIDLEV